MDPDALRKNVSGTVVGFMPASLTCEAKLVIWATTRHGAVTGERSSRVLGATVSVLAAAPSIARPSRTRGAGGVRGVSPLATSSGVPAHQASWVRKIEMLMTSPLSVARAGG